jgi:hypothetical protein
LETLVAMFLRTIGGERPHEALGLESERPAASALPPATTVAECVAAALQLGGGALHPKKGLAGQ